MKLNKVAKVITDNNDIFEFVTRAILKDEHYMYNVEVPECNNKEYIINIFEVDGVDPRDVNSILGDYLDRKDVELQILHEIAEEKEEEKSTKTNSSFICPKCGKVYDSFNTLAADCIFKQDPEYIGNGHMKFICSKCGGDIVVSAMEVYKNERK